MISTPLLALAPLLGGALGQGISPMVVNDDVGQIPYLNIYTTALVVLGTFFSWVVLDREAPPTPPSRSAALLADLPPKTLKEILQDAKKVKILSAVLKAHRMVKYRWQLRRNGLRLGLQGY